MELYPLGKKTIDDRFNSGDIFGIEVTIGLKKDGFNRNIFLISYFDLYNGKVTTEEREKKPVNKQDFMKILTREKRHELN